ncbi:DNA topoisomerase [Virgibacillus sp.]|uniref:DNA topoisomerase n=1 Tax=Virgibacillus sp. TaxID=1872700 RepID=UPI0025F4A461|nr:DNA topoisomerase [Virgibacillus sp.]
METEKDEFMTKEDADIVLNQLGERSNYQVFSKEKKEKPKKLFDLTTLQRHMNTKYKWSASKTLEVTQSLYEKQLVTYPRTNSQYLANDSELPGLLKAHKDNIWVSKIISNGYIIESSFIDSSKVTDHEAIIITNKMASNLMKDQEALYNEIFNRFVAAFYPPAVKKEVIATFNDGQYTFKAKETFLIELGWRELFEGSIEKGTLEACILGDIGDYEIFEKETKPPKRYTEATLLSDMENAGKYAVDEDEKKLLKSVSGIGTVATRADIIETLINRGFVEKKSNNLQSTTLGKEIIGMMPEDFALYSVKLTAFFESMLAEIENGDLDEQSFYEELKGLIQRTSIEMRKHIKKVTTPTKEIIAPCPNCGNNMYENSKAYYCSGYKDGCMTSLWKNGLEKLGKNKITKNEAQKLLNGKKINVRLKSKAGKAYKKDVVFDKEKGWVVFADKK